MDAVDAPPIPISLPPRMNNDYWILRHGLSLANEAGIIVSDLVNGQKSEFGLAPIGFEQAKAAGQQLYQELTAASLSVSDVLVLASPFSRTLQTATTLAQTLGELSGGSVPKVEAPEGLRERYFGAALELKSHERYNEVWAKDAINPYSAPIGGESVCQVAHRIAELLRRVDGEHDGKTIILVSHGDILQILQATLCGLESYPNDQRGTSSEGSRLTTALSNHRQYSLETGELRSLKVPKSERDKL